MDFSTRFQALNPRQQEAVTTIDGPVLVVAGPGTGKTELLSMRAAHILNETDTLPGSILCLTFTESGARAMQERLAGIIGPDAFKVAIHTFHSFGTDIMNQYSEFFYQGSDFRPADDLDQYTILRRILDELPHTSPLRASMNGEFTYQRDIARTISELKKAGLTGDELRLILDDNTAAMEAVEADFQKLFHERLSKATIEPFARIAEQLPAHHSRALPSGVAAFGDVLRAEAQRVASEAQDSGSQKTITAFKNSWFEKNSSGDHVFKARKRGELLRAVADIYDRYLADMQAAKRYDFDDMILRVTHAMEVFPELRYNLEERYQYIMVDEFQDTNLAQMRILHALTGHESQEGRANIMAVGDDDQAIYSFQGADVGNILTFSDRYHEPRIITLQDNYRSTAPILDASRTIITQGTERLETLLATISKELTAHHQHHTSTVQLTEYATIEQEYTTVAQSIAQLIQRDTSAGDIAVIARKHDELVALLPYLAQAGVPVSYERRESILDSELVLLLERFASVLIDLGSGSLERAGGQLPELLTHPSFALTPHTLWQISLKAYETRQHWLEVMMTMPETKALAEWIIGLSQQAAQLPLERMIDLMLGLGDDERAGQSAVRLADYFLPTGEPAEIRDHELDNLEILRTLRDHIRESMPDEPAPRLSHMKQFIDSHRLIGSHILARRAPVVDHDRPVVHLMTAHKSKGLEFEHVYIIDAVDSVWGEKARGGARKISYPANLPIAPHSGTIDERLRLFFVAMTRAKSQLHISYALADAHAKATMRASFLTNLPHNSAAPPSTDQRLETLVTAWHDRLTAPIAPTQAALLAPLLEQYHLSATHLNSFLDVSRGGPRSFFVHNLLRMPSTMSAEASYGSAVHAALANAHNYAKAHNRPQPLEQTLAVYDQTLANFRQLTESDLTLYRQKGRDVLSAFIAEHPQLFTPNQRVELSFRHQAVRLGEARLTGAMDVVTINQADHQLDITDYKTGKPSTSWAGKTPYEKIKLHKYRQQLMFYQLLAKHSRDWSGYEVGRNQLTFVEADKEGAFHTLEASITPEDLRQFEQLIEAVWQRIMQLDFPDTSHYEPTLQGVTAFEQSLLDTKS